MLLVGVPRSGTTWVMEIIETLGNYRVVFEPFHSGFYPIVKRFASRFFDDPAYRVVFRPYLPMDQEDPKLMTYFEMVLRGRVAGYWYSPPTRLVKNLKWIKKGKVLVKDVWIPRLLPWITYRFGRKVKEIFLLLRHPCAVIESQIRTCIGNPLCRYSKHIVKKVILKQLNDIVELRDIADIIRPKLENLEKAEELLAIIWSMDYFVPLYYKNNFTIIAYEELIMYPIPTLKNLNQLLELDAKDFEISKIIMQPSPTTKDIISARTANVYKWKKRLSRQQIESILRVIHAFNLTFYDESIEPNYDELRYWKPT